MLEEGMRSSLTFPLIIDGRPIGAVFFSSRHKGNFKATHEKFLRQIAGHLAIALDKMLLIERIQDQADQLARLNKENEKLITGLEETVARRTQELERAYEEVVHLKEQLEGENIYLKEKISQECDFDEIIGRSEPIRQVLALVRKVAPTDSNILLGGETGTGKELIARAVHGLSARKDKPLVTVHCAAIPETLISSALFGHEKGAFTGAHARQPGRFEVADGGTLFLDEVGDLPGETQVKLLRVLQEGTFERLGSTETIRVNVRVIAATHADLEKKIEEGTFREDLYYRLNVFPVTVPPLRERKDDIPDLAAFFCDIYARRLGKKIDKISKKALDLLVSYAWPGNVRELQNVIERAVILCESTCLTVDGSFFKKPPGADPVKPGISLIDVERDHIQTVLQDTGWIIKGPAGAARRLAMNPSTLYSRMKKLGISKAASRDDMPS
jgi:transcriptional regulator with GAF, ATPase, and Fis domain